MTRRRFFAAPDLFDSSRQLVNLDADEVRHLRDVLRLKPGDAAYVFDGTGNEFHCRLLKVDRDRAELEILEPVKPASAESPLKLTLAIALLKGEKFDLVVQKATELGVNSVLPVTTRHADIHLRDAADAEKRVIRWRRIALEAAKQSGRAVVPTINPPVGFQNLLATTPHSNGLLFSERDGQSLVEVCGSSVYESITALIGSEGGWSNEEITEARNAGWRVVTLGGRILRAETAAIVITALLQHLYGDLR